jgi:pyruvate, orthophosphate dikinase
LQYFVKVGEEVNFIIGSSLDVPRACMRANAIVSEGDVAFLSVNTNMLTELVYGMSRVDTMRLVENYVNLGIMQSNPFTCLDQTGVGGLLKIAKNLVRKTNRFIRMGVRGEQAADAASIEFFDALGMDYVSTNNTCGVHRVAILCI